MSASAVLEDSEAVFADISVHLEKTKAEVRSRSDGLAFITAFPLVLVLLSRLTAVYRI